MRTVLLSILSLTAVLLASEVNAADWGDLKVKLVYGGDVPKSVPIKVTKDPEVCGKLGLMDESLVVNKDNKGIRDVLVFLYQRSSAKTPPIHPSYAALAKKPVTFDNDKCRFVPRVLTAMTGQTILIGNKDTVAHNTKVDTTANSPINPLIPAGLKLPQVYKKSESRQAQVSCSIHPWMVGWVLIKDHPYCGVSNEDGEVTIKNIPAGKWTFQFWQEKSGYVREVVQGGKDVSWRRGRVELTIKSGTNDMGNVVVKPENFEE